jgi:hypothetical protein
MKDRKVKQVLSSGMYQWEAGGQKKRLKKGKYDGYILYLCMNTE